MRPEVIHGDNAVNRGCKGCRNAGIARIRDMVVAVHREVMNLGVEGCTNRARGARKIDDPVSHINAVEDVYKRQGHTRCCEPLYNDKARSKEPGQGARSKAQSRMLL